MAHVLNYPANTTDAMDRWRADANERMAAEESFKKELGAREEADRERRRTDVSQAQSDAFNAWFDARFAQAVAEGSAFDNAWVASIAEALGQDRRRTHDQVANAVAEVEAGLESRLAAAEMRANEAEARGSAAEARAARLEKDVGDARAQLRAEFIQLGDDLRARTRDTAAVVGVEIREQLEAKLRHSSRRWKSERKRPRNARERRRLG
jgi:hypothetical protein